jgi:hypothetical protein
MFKKNEAVTGFTFTLVNKTDGSAVTTGTPSGYYTLDGGTQGSVTATPVHEGNGQWSVNLTAGEMNGDVVGLLFTHTDAIPVNFTIKTDTKKISELQDLTAAAVNAEVDTAFTDYDPPTKAELDSGFAALNDPTAAAITDAVWDEAKAGHVGAGSMGEEVQSHATSAEVSALNDLSAAAVNAEVDTALADYDGPTKAELDAGLAALNDPTAAAVADAVWDEAKSGHVGAGSFGEEVQAHAISAEVSAVETDTQDIQSRLPAALVSGRMSSDAVAVSGSTAAADNVEANIGNLDAAVSGRATPAQVNTEVSDVLKTDTIPELSQAAPVATPTFATALMLLYMTLRNQLTTTASQKTISNNAGTVIAKKALSDDGTTYTEQEMAAGP